MCARKCLWFSRSPLGVLFTPSFWAGADENVWWRGPLLLILVDLVQWGRLRKPRQLYLGLMGRRRLPECPPGSSSALWTLIHTPGGFSHPADQVCLVATHTIADFIHLFFFQKKSAVQAPLTLYIALASYHRFPDTHLDLVSHSQTFDRLIHIAAHSSQESVILRQEQDLFRCR